MNINQLIQDFLNGGILEVKPNEAFFTDEYNDFMQQSYERIDAFLHKREFSDNLKSAYLSLFNVVPQPKIENLNLLIFSAIYMIQRFLYFQYPAQQHKLDFRFNLDCYHMITYALNGIMVSDAYVEGYIKRFFSEKYLDYKKKQIYAPQQARPNQFFGQSIEIPKMNTDEGVDFAKNLQSIFKPYRKKLPIQHFESQEPEIRSMHSPQMMRKVKLNVHTVSPSMAQALKITSVGNEKPKLINHPIQKSSLGDQNVLNKLKDLEEIRTKIPDAKPQKSKRVNIVDSHHLTYPPKEYFQKNKKVDGLFRTILELNYVLGERKETLGSLPSFQGFQQRLPYLPQYLVEVPPLTNNLVSSKSEQFVDIDMDAQLEASKMNKFEQYANTTKGSFPQQQTHFTTFYKTKTTLKQAPIQFGNQTTDNFKYENKQKQYQRQFNNILNKDNTDLKINQIQSKLARQTLYMKKNIQKQIHNL